MHLDWTRGQYKYLFVEPSQDVALLHVATCLPTCVEMPSSEEHVLLREVRSAALFRPTLSELFITVAPLLTLISLSISLSLYLVVIVFLVRITISVRHNWIVPQLLTVSALLSELEMWIEHQTLLWNMSGHSTLQMSLESMHVHRSILYLYCISFADYKPHIKQSYLKSTT